VQAGGRRFNSREEERCLSADVAVVEGRGLFLFYFISFYFILFFYFIWYRFAG
jgi:hypothetical protein